MLKRFTLPPGIRHESTQYAASGSWYDSDNIRFRSGMVESIGGWVRDGMYSLEGVGRASHTSRDYAGNNYQSVGTDWKYYVITGTAPVDVTPIRDSGTVSGTNLFTAAAGSSLLTVSDVNNGLAVNDWVNFEDVLAPGGFPGTVTEELLEQERGFQVASVALDGTSYEIYLWDGSAEVEASIDDLFGTQFKYMYRVSSGISSQVLGNGFGSSVWGGDSMPTSFPLDSTPVSSADGQSYLTFADASTPLVIGEYAYLQGLTGTVGTGTSIHPTTKFDLTSMNDHWWRVSAVPTAGTFRVDLADAAYYGTGFSIVGDDSGKGGTAGTFYQSDWTVPSVTGAIRGWGESSEESSLTADVRRVYIDNYGEDLMFCNSGGPIYYYDISANTSVGIPLDPAGGLFAAKEMGSFSGSLFPPARVDSFIVSKKDGHCVALGCSDVGDAVNINSMLVRWSDQNNPFDWGPSSTNTSGGQVLRAGSKILGGVSTKDEVVIFTDSAVYSMRFIGPPDVFSFTLITDGVGLVGQRAVGSASSAVFLMGNDGFYVYTGAVEPLACPVVNYVFDDFNRSQSSKIFTALSSGLSEMSWFYPSSLSFEPDRYVTYNYEENVWYYGSMDMSALSELSGSSSSLNRTSWQDSIVFDVPMATYLLEYTPSMGATPLIQRSAVMSHEVGSSAFGEDMDSYIESGELDISDGDNFSFVSRAIPDLEIFGASDSSSMASVNLSIQGRDFPGQASASKSSTDISFSYDQESSGRDATYTPVSNGTSIRARARSIAIRYSASANDFRWRLGESRFDFRPDGKR